MKKLREVNEITQRVPTPFFAEGNSFYFMALKRKWTIITE